MFNQNENMIARAEYQMMQGVSASDVEGVEVASELGWLRRMLNAFANRKPATAVSTPEQTWHSAPSIVLHPEH